MVPRKPPRLPPPAPPSPSNIDAASPRGARQTLETTATRRTPSSQRLSAPSTVTPSNPAHRGRRDQLNLSPTARTITIVGKIHCHKGNHLPANCHSLLGGRQASKYLQIVGQFRGTDYLTVGAIVSGRRSWGCGQVPGRLCRIRRIRGSSEEWAAREYLLEARQSTKGRLARWHIGSVRGVGSRRVTISRSRST